MGTSTWLWLSWVLTMSLMLLFDTDRARVKDDTVGSRSPSRDREDGNQVKILEDSYGDWLDDLNVDEMDTDRYNNNIPRNFHLFFESFQNGWSPHQPNPGLVWI